MADRALEMVRWIDSHGGAASNGGWLETARLPDEMALSVIESVGWVMYEDDERLIIAGSHLPAWDQVGEVLSIVKVAIRDRVPLHLPRKSGSPAEDER